jgi:drug/metabolite transporter (DMT)-like permease
MSLNFMMVTLCLVTSMLWGAWGFFGKIALARGMSPYAVFASTALISAAIATAFALVGPGWMALKSAPWSVFALLSGAAMALGGVTFYEALSRQSASVVIVSTATYPLFTLVLSAAFLGERLTLAQAVGAGLVVIGLVLVLTAGAR